MGLASPSSPAGPGFGSPRSYRQAATNQPTGNGGGASTSIRSSPHTPLLPPSPPSAPHGPHPSPVPGSPLLSPGFLGIAASGARRRTGSHVLAHAGTGHARTMSLPHAFAFDMAGRDPPPSLQALRIPGDEALGAPPAPPPPSGQRLGPGSAGASPSYGRQSHNSPSPHRDAGRPSRPSSLPPTPPAQTAAANGPGQRTLPPLIVAGSLAGSSAGSSATAHTTGARRSTVAVLSPTSSLTAPGADALGSGRPPLRSPTVSPSAASVASTASLGSPSPAAHLKHLMQTAARCGKHPLAAVATGMDCFRECVEFVGRHDAGNAALSSRPMSPAAPGNAPGDPQMPLVAPSVAAAARIPEPHPPPPPADAPTARSANHRPADALRPPPGPVLVLAPLVQSLLRIAPPHLDPQSISLLAASPCVQSALEAFWQGLVAMATRAIIDTKHEEKKGGTKTGQDAKGNPGFSIEDEPFDGRRCYPWLCWVAATATVLDADPQKHGDFSSSLETESAGPDNLAAGIIPTSEGAGPGQTKTMQWRTGQEHDQSQWRNSSFSLDACLSGPSAKRGRFTDAANQMVNANAPVLAEPLGSKGSPSVLAAAFQALSDLATLAVDIAAAEAIHRVDALERSFGQQTKTSSFAFSLSSPVRTLTPFCFRLPPDNSQSHKRPLQHRSLSPSTRGGDGCSLLHALDRLWQSYCFDHERHLLDSVFRTTSGVASAVARAMRRSLSDSAMNSSHNEKPSINMVPQLSEYRLLYSFDAFTMATDVAQTRERSEKIATSGADRCPGHRRSQTTLSVSSHTRSLSPSGSVINASCQTLWPGYRTISKYASRPLAQIASTAPEPIATRSSQASHTRQTSSFEICEPTAGTCAAASSASNANNCVTKSGKKRIFGRILDTLGLGSTPKRRGLDVTSASPMAPRPQDNQTRRGSSSSVGSASSTHSASTEASAPFHHSDGEEGYGPHGRSQRLRRFQGSSTMFGNATGYTVHEASLEEFLNSQSASESSTHWTPTVHDLRAFRRSKIAFLSICEDVVVAQSTSGLCAAFPLIMKDSYDNMMQGTAISDETDAYAKFPFLFLNQKPTEACHCHFFSKDAEGGPCLILCISEQFSTELLCFRVPLTAIRRGYRSLTSSYERVFASARIIHPGFAEFNSINSLALIHCQDTRADGTIIINPTTQLPQMCYKVFELVTFTEVLSIQSAGIVDIKFGAGVLLTTTAGDEVYQILFNEKRNVPMTAVPYATVLQDQARSTGVRAESIPTSAERQTPRPFLHPQVRGINEALHTLNVHKMRATSLDTSTESAAALEDAKTVVRDSARNGGLIAVRVYSLRNAQLISAVVTPIVRGEIIQLLELFRSTLMLKQLNEPLRLFHLQTGSYHAIPENQFSTPFAQLYLYARGQYFCVHAGHLELRSEDGTLDSRIVSREASGIYRALQGCTQTGSNVHITASEGHLLMLSSDFESRAPDRGDRVQHEPEAPANAALEAPTARSDAAVADVDHNGDTAIQTPQLAPTATIPSSSVLLFSVVDQGFVDRLAPSTVQTADGDEHRARRALEGTTTLRFDEGSGLLCTANSSGVVHVWGKI